MMQEPIRTVGNFACSKCPSLVINKEFEIKSIEESLHLKCKCQNCQSEMTHTFNTKFLGLYTALISHGYIPEMIMEDTLSIAVRPVIPIKALENAIQPLEFDIDLTEKDCVLLINGRLRAEDYEDIEAVGMTKEEYFDAALQSLIEWAYSLPDTDMAETASLEDASEDGTFIDPADTYAIGIKEAEEVFDDDEDGGIIEEEEDEDEEGEMVSDDDEYNSDDNSDEDFEPAGDEE